ncbi:two-component system response regulator [Paenibacillus sp. PCH8]|uniref:response regulator transcription factor n=1 Tax=Paenibacillus sp. PCH8 TaxID=2066524 RepID=UPI000CF95977|nr:response regulator [Paenibacillus sp. PCH8]PQP81490.1 two-component system response regulator [Paenibacillus sp. PCH8]
MYKVLLVDDEPLAIEGLQLMINWEKHGFEIRGVCSNGEEAIRMMQQDRPDLVVTDIRMPVMNGLELIEEARRLEHESVLFAITSGYSDFNYARQAIRLGVSNYLTKPVDSTEAEDMLERLRLELQEREKQEQIREYTNQQRIKAFLSAQIMGQKDSSEQENSDIVSRLNKSHWTYLRIAFQGDTQQACSVAEHMASETTCCYVIERSKGIMGLVWGDEAPSEIGPSERIKAFAHLLMSNMQDNDCINISIAVGLTVSTLANLSDSFRSVKEVERYLFFNQERLLFAEDMEPEILPFDPETLSDVERINDLLENGSADELSYAVRNAFDIFKKMKAAPELIHIFSTHIMFRGLSLCKELGGEPHALMHKSASRILKGSHRKIEEVAHCLENFCLDCKSALAILRERQVGGIQAMVAEYVQSHYKETFTIQELSERFFMNPVHLGQSFLRKYGKGVLEVVHDLRMEEAKRLLQETNQTSSAIAEQVGYRSYQHFLKHFEKRTTMKPLEYRQKSTI